MKIEIACVDKSANYQELLELHYLSTKIDTLAVPSSIISKFRDITENIDLAGIVDYPHGLSDTSVRVFETLFFAKRGVSKIDLVLNNVAVAEHNWKELSDDVTTIKNVCDEYGLELRIVLEYKLFPPDKMNHLCQFLKDLGIYTVVTATGQIADMTSEHVISAYEMNTIGGLQVILCSRLWSQRHIEVFGTVNPYGLRFVSLDSAKTYLNNLKFV